MAEVLDFEKRKPRHEIKRKAAKADALKARLATARLKSENPAGSKAQATATKRLLSLFKNPPKPKR